MRNARKRVGDELVRIYSSDQKDSHHDEEISHKDHGIGEDIGDNHSVVTIEGALLLTCVTLFSLPLFFNFKHITKYMYTYTHICTGSVSVIALENLLCSVCGLDPTWSYITHRYCTVVNSIHVIGTIIIIIVICLILTVSANLREPM